MSAPAGPPPHPTGDSELELPAQRRAPPHQAQQVAALGWRTLFWTLFRITALLTIAVFCTIAVLGAWVIITDIAAEWTDKVEKAQQHVISEDQALKAQCKTDWAENKCDHPIRLALEGCEAFGRCMASLVAPVKELPLFKAAIHDVLALVADSFSRDFVIVSAILFLTSAFVVYAM